MSLVPASLTNFATTSAEIVVFFVSEVFFTVFSSCARASVTSPLSFFSTVSVAFVSFAIFSNVLSVFRVSDGFVSGVVFPVSGVVVLPEFPPEVLLPEEEFPPLFPLWLVCFTAIRPSASAFAASASLIIVPLNASK